MKLKELQSLLQGVEPFRQAKAALEQYPTGAHLAACMLYTIDSTYDDLHGKTVIDLGSGTGMLSIGCAILGAAHVVGLELDSDAIEVAQENVQQYDDPLPIDFVNVNLRELVPDLLLDPSQDDVAGEDAQQRGRGAGAGGRGKGRRGGRHQQQGRQGIRQGRGRQGGGRAQGRGQAVTESDEDEAEDGEGEESEASESGHEDEKGGTADQILTLDQKSSGLEECTQQLQILDGTEAATQARSPHPGSQGDGSRHCEPENLQGQQVAPDVPTGKPHYTCSVPILQHLKADTCVLNPPFGTKGSWGIDMLFLKAAFRMCRGCVYSLHKSSTRQHIHMVATKQLGAVQAEVVAELRYNLPATMKFHKQVSKDIEVDLWRFQVGDSNTDAEQ